MTDVPESGTHRTLLAGIGAIAAAAWLGALTVLGIVSGISDDLPEFFTTFTALGSVVLGVVGVPVTLAAFFRS